jgi:hypothetical protein
MSGAGDRSGTDPDWDEALAENAEISTTVFVAVLVVLAFSIDVIGFEWAVVAMLGLIAIATATE